MPDDPQRDIDAAIRAIRLRAMLDRKGLRHLGDPDEPAASMSAGEDARDDDQAPEADSAS